MSATLVTAARTAYQRRDWHAAFEGFTKAEAQEDLAAEDTFLLADAAWWLGEVEESLAAAERAYRRYLEGDLPARAAMAAIHIAVDLLLRGDTVLGSGWLSRAQRLLDDHPDCAERGYLMYILEVEAGLGGPVGDDVVASAAGVADLGRRHNDANLVALSIVGHGRALVKQGRTTEGLSLLDEAMVAVLTEDLHPTWAGNIYCHLMAACHELGDVRRLVSWTGATTQWLDSLPAAVLFTGICRVHRSQVLQASGGWSEAETEAAKVCADLEHLHVASAAEAHYQVAELRRLRGEYDDADVAYEQARARGRDPQPGLALLQCARGQHDAALAGLTIAVGSAVDALRRLPLRVAQGEVALAAGEVQVAEQAATDVAGIAARYATSGFTATAHATRGAVYLAQDRLEEAVSELREAHRLWSELGVPYELARVQALLGRACQALGDLDGARRERAAAQRVFAELGAVGDLEQVTALDGTSRGAGKLTPREVEVLAVVALGGTNREVAAELFISRKTVARHLSSIFAKLGCSSRTAATAYAFEQGLVPRSPR
ncbi:LuxR C-terminal-related transcriptional regulator [Pseudactinotalea sp. Z1739]|uniref:helix-turn-helix transcriptional regulator n=1 Tax=Pseudactinotalea sp. Z1739 TaxID=3413028 RepID=UPI003C7DF82C